MKANVKNSGIWTPAKKIYVKDSGSWKVVKKGYVKKDGIWSQFHANSVQLLIDSTVTNYNIGTAVNAALGATPTEPVEVDLLITENGIVGGTGSSAITTGVLPNGSVVRIVNNGKIYGRGGAGGVGNQVGESGYHGIVLAAARTINMTVTNNGEIRGGGGGGGGGGYGGLGGQGGQGYYTYTHSHEGPFYDAGKFLQKWHAAGKILWIWDSQQVYFVENMAFNIATPVVGIEGYYYYSDPSWFVTNNESDFYRIARYQVATAYTTGGVGGAAGAGGTGGNGQGYGQASSSGSPGSSGGGGGAPLGANAGWGGQGGTGGSGGAGGTWGTAGSSGTSGGTGYTGSGGNYTGGYPGTGGQAGRTGGAAGSAILNTGSSTVTVINNGIISGAY